MEEKGDGTVVETKKKKIGRDLAKFTFFIFIIGLLAFACFSGYMNYNEIENDYKESRASNTFLKKAIKLRDLEINKLRETINSINEVVDATSEAENKKLKMDIIRYIQEHYIKVSKVVAEKIAETIVIMSEKYDLPPELVLAVIEVESYFTPNCKSKAGAIGLMQVMPEWVPKLGVKRERDLYEIDINIETGIKVLKIHIKEEKGSIKQGLFKYVNKDKTYSTKVFVAAGRFSIFRHTKIKDSLSKKSKEIKIHVSRSKPKKVAKK